MCQIENGDNGNEMFKSMYNIYLNIIRSNWNLIKEILNDYDYMKIGVVSENEFKKTLRYFRVIFNESDFQNLIKIDKDLTDIPGTINYRKFYHKYVKV